MSDLNRCGGLPVRDDRAGRWISLIAVIAVAVMIFLFSAQEGDDSAMLSEGVTEWVLTVLVPGYADFTAAQKLAYLERAGFAVRKLAHFSEFALLALTLSVHLHYRMRGGGRIALTAWVIATLYAGTDELHQMFVGGRGPALRDVAIDSAGALVGAFAGVALILLWHRLKRRRNRLA